MQAVKRFGWFTEMFLFFLCLVFSVFFKSGVLFLYKAVSIIFNKPAFSFFPFFDYRLLKITEEKEGRQEAGALSQPDKNHQEERR